MAPFEPKSICVFGAGAIGGAIAARLAADPALAGSDISIVARGAHLAAIRANGIRVEQADKAPLVAKVTATDKAAELGQQDLVIVTLKGHQLADAVDDIAGLLKPGARVVMIQNGIPWWYFHGDSESGHEGRQIEALDPASRIWSTLGPERVIGGVIYQGAQVIEPGVIKLSGIGLLHVGEPNGTMSDDLEWVRSLFQSSGWDIHATPRLRDEIWVKLEGNAAFNPVSALTRATIDKLVSDPLLLELSRKIMTEVRQVAGALGCRFDIDIEERLDRTRTLGASKTSTLQDVESGRRLEIMPITQAVCLLGDMVDVPTPANDTVLALVSELDRQLAAAKG